MKTIVLQRGMKNSMRWAGIKKRLRRQNAPKAQRQTKKNATSGRAIAPPRRVSLAINKNGFKQKDVQLSTDDGRIIALSQLRGQDKKSTKSCSQFVHNCTIRQNGQRKVRKCGKVNKKREIALQIRADMVSYIVLSPRA